MLCRSFADDLMKPAISADQKEVTGRLSGLMDTLCATEIGAGGPFAGHFAGGVR